MNKKILIIGSEGFIGSHLVTYLSLKGFQVISCDIISKKEDGYICVDKNSPDYTDIFRNTTFDYCLNCSGAASVPFSFETPVLDFTLNVYNVVKMLDSIRVYSPECKFMNFSSAAVYGNPKAIPISENFEKKPISPYGYHKMMVETVLDEYTKYFNLKTCTLRLFSAYGNGLKKQIMFDLYKKFTENDVIDLFGTGKETRDYIHIDDICKIVELVITNSDFNNDIINVANGEEIELQTIVTEYKKCMNSNKEIKYSGDARTGDPLRWRADISKIKQWGYKPSVFIQSGIKEYIEWIKNV